MTDALRGQVTILLMTHFNQHYLPRALAYYGELADCLLVADSSDAAYQGSLPAGSRYLHAPDTLYAPKVHMALTHVETPYTILCGVDDFIVPAGIRACLDFLRDNPDFSSAQGRYLYFNPKNLHFMPLYLLSAKMRVSSEEPQKRITEQVLPYMHQNYAVHDTAFLKDFFGDAAKLVPRTLFLEMALSMASAIKGKHAILDVLYSGREASLTSNGKVLPTLPELVADPEYKVYYDGFLALLSKRLAAKAGISMAEAMAYVRHALDVFIQVFLPMAKSTMKQELGEYLAMMQRGAVAEYARLRCHIDKHRQLSTERR